MRRRILHVLREFHSRHPRLGMHLSQGAKFAIAGGIGAIVDLSSLWVQVHLLGVHPEIGVVFSTLLALCTVFLLNKYITFRARSGAFWMQAVRFAAARTTSLLLNVTLSIIFIRLGVYYLFARVLAILIVMSWNYMLMHVFVFGQ